MGRRPGRAPVTRSRGLGGEQVEGRQAVAELLVARRRPVLDVWMAQDLEPAPVLERIERLAAGARVPVRRVSRGRLEAEAATDAPQGVLAHARPLPEADLDDLARAPKAFLLAVDGVTDPHNLGALLRSAEAAGATGAVLPRHRAVHVTPTVAKAAAGAVERVPMAVVGGMPAALVRAKELGCWVVGLAEDGDRPLYDLPVATEPVVVVVGSEGAGLSRLARARCDLEVHIPMRGHLASLNVGAAGALALFEVARRRQETIDTGRSRD
ncbi:MAG TPA: 23S rRNA (guanosine(2251)-2'-O)-methyltransferase RlmB [Acidimicrobiales bacterium]|nr:23S rRNA (guanosine(2251)-2'-O)-methyltransferase RlmB [Acidimicrobiales bacterium]